MLLRRRRVDAVICGNDVMAIGVRDAAERLLGLNVPKNLAIVGHDGISMGTWESHSITTVAFDRVAYFDAIVDFIEREDEAHGSNETVMPAMCGGEVQPDTLSKSTINASMTADDIVTLGEGHERRRITKDEAASDITGTFLTANLLLYRL